MRAQRGHCNSATAIVILLTLVRVAHAQGAIVAMNLGPALDRPPVVQSDWEPAVTIDRFLPANGNSEQVRATPTSSSLAWDSNALYVRFRCADPDPVFRDGVRLSRTDRIEVGFLAPGASQDDLWQFSVEENGTASVTHRKSESALPDAKVTMGDQEWVADLTIPWRQLGGLPSSAFLLQLSRVRLITGEVLSPSAVDFHDGPVTTDLAPAATDEFMEVTLGGTRGTKTGGLGLITLPSGKKRWERRAILHRATRDELKEIAGLQALIDSQPTSQVNLADRVRLAEIWYDLLDQDGFAFRPESGSWLLDPGELDPWTARHRFNDALAIQDFTTAHQVLDSLLKHFNRVSKAWFADGTPGDISDEAWTAIDRIDSATEATNQIVLHARAGQNPVDLYLSFPSTGGVRLHGQDTGFFSPPASFPLKAVKTANDLRVSANNMIVEIRLQPDWHIEIRDEDTRRPIWSVRKGDLLIHHNAEGCVAGVEIRGGLREAEAIFGMGERFDSFNQRGKTLTLWQTDAWDSLCRGGLENQAYKPIPLWHSTEGYSVFWNTSYEIRADFGKDIPDQYRVTAHGPIFDLYIWPGQYQEVLRQYTSLTGKPLLPPTWAFEPWMGGGVERWASVAGKTPTQAMLEVVNHFKNLDIPHSSIYAEGPASSDALLYKELDPLDIRILTWARSEPLFWSFNQIEEALPDLAPGRLPLMKLADGNLYSFPANHVLGEHFPYYDFTDPRGVDLLRAYLKPRLDLGVAGTMVDFGDLVPRSALFHDGSNGEQMHNWYAHLYHHYFHQVFEERRGDDHILFSRGAAPGSQAEVSQMGGDHASNFRGMDESIAGGLSISASGFSNWGVDIAGYQGRPDEEVYLRWIEFGAFSPLMRFHGTEPREPWNYGDAAIRTYKKYAWLRENLLPYIYGSAQSAHASGLPLMRAMPAVAPDEYMFGDDMLVAPVHTPGQHRAIILPAGHWSDLWTGLPVAGGKRDTAVPLDQIPVFLRAGALVPIAVPPDLAMGESMSSGRVSALLVTPPDSQHTVREWRLPGRDGATRLESGSQHSGFSVDVENWNELHFLIVAGLPSEIKRVTVDGASLPRLDSGGAESLPPGWTRLDQGRFLVRLPAGPRHLICIETID